MTDTISRAVESFTADPQSGRVSPQAVATLENGRARVRSGPFDWEADLPTVIGGGNQAPTPIAYLLGSLAACAVVLVADALGPQHGVEIDSITATASCSADLAALVGVEGADGRLQGVRLDVVIASSADADTVAALQQEWRRRCPVYLALLEPNQLSVSFGAADPS